jgi:hypothetical protein
MSSRRAEDVPLDPADVEDIRLRIEAHQRATEMEAASAKAFRSECERAHGEFLRAISRLDEERQVRHAEQLDELDVTYARARLAGPAVSAELLALRRLARDIARGLAAREAGRGGTRREDDGVVVRPEKDSLKKKNVSDSAAKNASDRFALAALERAAAEAEARARASYDERVVGDMRARRVAVQKTHDRETFELAAARGDAERAFFDARNKAAETLRVSARADGGEVKTKTSASSSSSSSRHRSETVSVAAVTAAARRAVRALTAAARAVAEKAKAAFVETKRAALTSTRKTFDSIFSSVTVTARGDVDWETAPPDTRRAAEAARRVERAARASFAKAAKQKKPSDARVLSTNVATKRRASSSRSRSDERRAGVLVFGPDDAALGDETANTTTPSRGYTDARVDDDDDGDDDAERARRLRARRRPTRRTEDRPTMRIVRRVSRRPVIGTGALRSRARASVRRVPRRWARAATTARASVCSARRASRSPTSDPRGARGLKKNAWSLCPRAAISIARRRRFRRRRTKTETATRLPLGDRPARPVFLHTNGSLPRRRRS